jgi:enoyl-CoA hydratase
VNKVVPASESVVDAARAMLRQMLANGPLALAECVDAVRLGGDLDLPAALELEAEKFGELAGTADMAEGTAAFLEKRAPKFSGT